MIEQQSDNLELRNLSWVTNLNLLFALPSFESHHHEQRVVKMSHLSKAFMRIIKTTELFLHLNVDKKHACVAHVGVHSQMLSDPNGP